MPCVDELVTSCFRIGLSDKDIICLLEHKHSVVISLGTNVDNCMCSEGETTET